MDLQKLSYIVSESQCSVVFEWHTEVVCARHANSRDAESTSNPSQEGSSFSAIGNVSSYVRTVLGVMLIMIAVLATLFYLRNVETRTCFRTWTNIFNFRRGAGRVQYCRVDTTEEARLLLDASDPTQCQTDSDDDLLHA